MAYRTQAQVLSELVDSTSFGLNPAVAAQFSAAITGILADENGDVLTQEFDTVANLVIGQDENGDDITVASLLGSGDVTVTTEGQSIFINSAATGNVDFEINISGGNIAFGQLGSGNDVLTIVPLLGAGSETLEDGFFQTLFDGGSGDDTLMGADTNDQLIGNLGDDMLMGGGGADDLAGSQGEDTIDGGAGSDTITGGADDDEISGGDGYDLVRSIRALADAEVTQNEDGSITVAVGGEGDVDTHTGVEYISFSDEGVVLGLGNQDQGDVARLYQVTLGRDGDFAGLQFWLNSLEGGSSLNSISNSFILSEEFGSILTNPNNEQFVEAIYGRGLDREGDEAGIDYWTGLLDEGAIDRAQLVAFFAESQEAIELYDNYFIIDDFDL